MNIAGTSDNDTLSGTAEDDLLNGLGGNDDLLAGAGNDTLYGGDGDDGLLGYTGNDWIDGGAGSDFVTFYYAGAVVVDLAAGTATGEGIDTLVGVEHVIGSAFSDVLTGDTANNDLWGEVGADRLDGAGGDDYLTGGNGNDTMDGGAGFDIVDYADGPVGAGATVNLSTGIAIDGFGGIDSLSGIEAVYGTWYNDAIAGNAEANLFLGAPGNDTIDGAGGIDMARFVGTRAQYTLTAGATYQVNGTATNEGIDALTGIERLDFSDYDLAIDLAGNAGVVAKVLGAVFGTGAAGVGNKTYAGIGLDFADDGWSYESLMLLALEVRLGSGASNEEVVDLLYTNLVGQPPDADTLAYYVTWITGGAYTQATLGIAAGDAMGIPALAANGLEFV